MTRAVCIYHANCADGFTAAWAVNWALSGLTPKPVEFIPAGYGSEPPALEGANVIIVDFSYPRAVIDQIASTANSLLILDHHKTAQADLSHLPQPMQDHGEFNYADLLARIEADPTENAFAIFDMDRSGAQLAWDFFRDGDRPLLVDVVADRDLWRWQIPNSRAINAVIQSYEMTWATWNDLAALLQADADIIWSTVNEGKAILRAHDKLVQSVIDTSKRRMIIAGHDVPVAAAPYALASDTAGKMAEGEPFAATYVDTPEGRAFSLRSRGDDGLDVAEIAKTFGGGGHRNAAGFKVAAGWEGDAV